MKFDLHFHTTLSDGLKTPAEVLAIAEDRGIGFLACTDHDLINTALPELARQTEIRTIQGVELSSSDYENGNKAAHLTCYSQNFKGRVFDILEGVRSGRKEKIQKQVDKLRQNGFHIDQEAFFTYWQNLGSSPDNLNNGHLREYLFLDPRNESVVQKVTGAPYDKETFIRSVLSKTGKFSHIGAIDNLPPYEPSVELCGEVAKENHAVLSIAHPNHTFKSLEEFSTLVPGYVDKGVNALEIHISTPPEWIKCILETRKKYNLLLTFGSDCHFEKSSVKHGMIGDLNPYLAEDFIQKEFENFLVALWYAQ